MTTTSTGHPHTTTLQSREEAIVASFAELDDWEERYRAIIARGRDLEDLPDDLKTNKLKVQGCQSQIWLHAELTPEGKVHFRADSDAMIVRGLIAMLLEVYSDATPAEILATEPTFIAKIGLESHLSPTRTNGLHSMLEQMFYYAKVLQTIAQARA